MFYTHLLRLCEKKEATHFSPSFPFLLDLCFDSVVLNITMESNFDF